MTVPASSSRAAFLRASFSRGYGAGPLHLLALLGCFALAGAAALHVNEDPLRLRYAAWFLGAAIAHDLVLFPLYALLDRSLGALVRRRRVPAPGPVDDDSVNDGPVDDGPVDDGPVDDGPVDDGPVDDGSVNYVRAPALLSGLLLLVFCPVILQRSEPAYGAASGLDEDVFLGRWLLVTGVLFLASAVLYALRGRRSRAPA